MDAKLEQYRIFNAVAEAGSFSGAAEKLFVTQSAVSQSVKQLEQTLGVTLLLRTSKGISLTQEGAVLYEYTSAALEMLNTGSRRLTLFNELKEGELRIAAGDTVSSYYLLPRLEAFHRAYPDIKIQVVNRVTREAVEMVKRGTIDLAFGNLPIEEEGLVITPCLEVHDVFVAGKGFEHLKGKALSRAEIAALPLILLERKSNSRVFVDNEFLKSGSPLAANIELGAHELLLQFAQIGLGVSCVTKEFAGKYLQSGEVFELEMRKPLPGRAVGFCYPPKPGLTPAAVKFIDSFVVGS